MMSVTQQLNAVTEKTERLIELCTALLHENELLKNDRELLGTSLKDSKAKITELEKKLKVLKVARSFSDPSEKSLDIKKKINEFVQEIDKCIVLLKK